MSDMDQTLRGLLDRFATFLNDAPVTDESEAEWKRLDEEIAALPLGPRRILLDAMGELLEKTNPWDPVIERIRAAEARGEITVPLDPRDEPKKGAR